MNTSTIAAKLKELEDRKQAEIRAIFTEQVDAIYAASARKFAAELGQAETPSTEDATVAKLRAAIAKIPICDDGKAAVADVVSILAGRSVAIAPPIKKAKWASGIFGVCLKNPNSHNYGKGVFLTFGGGDNAYRANGTEGNHLPDKLPESASQVFRHATKEEIVAFLESAVGRLPQEVVAAIEYDAPLPTTEPAETARAQDLTASSGP